MKQTPTSLITWIAYVINLQKAGNKQILVRPSEKWLGECGFLRFLLTCFEYNGREGDTINIWLNTPRVTPMTTTEAMEFYVPLRALPVAELAVLCRFAGVSVNEVEAFLGGLNTGEK